MLNICCHINPEASQVLVKNCAGYAFYVKELYEGQIDECKSIDASLWRISRFWNAPLFDQLRYGKGLHMIKVYTRTTDSLFESSSARLGEAFARFFGLTLEIAFILVRTACQVTASICER